MSFDFEGTPVEAKRSPAIVISLAALAVVLLLGCGGGGSPRFPGMLQQKTERSRQACADLNATRDLAFTGGFIEKLVLCASNQRDGGETLAASIEALDAIGGANGLEEVLDLLKRPRAEPAASERYPFLMSALTFLDKASFSSADQSLRLAPGEHQAELSQLLARLNVHDLGRLVFGRTDFLLPLLAEMNLLQQAFPGGSLSASWRASIEQEPASAALGRLSSRYFGAGDAQDVFLDSLSQLMQPETTRSLDSGPRSECLLRSRQEAHQPGLWPSPTQPFLGCSHEATAEGTFMPPTTMGQRLRDLQQDLQPSGVESLARGLEVMTGHFSGLTAGQQSSIAERLMAAASEAAQLNPRLLPDSLAFLERILGMQATDFERLATIVDQILADPQQLHSVLIRIGASRVNTEAEELLLNGGTLEICGGLVLPPLIVAGIDGGPASQAANSLDAVKRRLLQYLQPHDGCPAAAAPLAAFMLASLDCRQITPGGSTVGSQECGIPSSTPLYARDAIALAASLDVNGQTDADGTAQGEGDDARIAAAVQSVLAGIQERLAASPRYLIQQGWANREFNVRQWRQATQAMRAADSLSIASLLDFEARLEKDPAFNMRRDWLTGLISTHSQDLAAATAMLGNVWREDPAYNAAVNAALNGTYPLGPMAEVFLASLQAEVIRGYFTADTPAATDQVWATAGGMFLSAADGSGLFGPSLNTGNSHVSHFWGKGHNAADGTLITPTEYLAAAGRTLNDPTGHLQNLQGIGKYKDLFAVEYLPRLMGKDLPDALADRLEQGLFRLTNEQLPQAATFASALEGIDYESNGLTSQPKGLVAGEGVNPRDLRMFALFYSQYFLTVPALGPGLQDSAAAVAGEDRTGRALPAKFRLGLSMLLPQPMVWPQFQRIFKSIDPGEPGGAMRTVSEYVDSILPVSEDWLQGLGSLAEPLLLPKSNRDFLAVDEGHQALLPFLAFNLASTARFDIGNKQHWLVMPVAWHGQQQSGADASNTAAGMDSPCFQAQADADGKPMRHACPITFSTPEALREYYQGQLRALFCPIIALDADGRLLAGMGLKADQPTSVFCAAHPSVINTAYPQGLGRRILTDLADVGNGNAHDHTLSDLTWRLSLEKSKRRGEAATTQGRRLLARFGGVLPELGYWSRWVDGQLSAFERQEGPLVDALLSTLRRDYDLPLALAAKGHLSAPDQLSALHVFLTLVSSTYSEAATEGISALQFTDRLVMKLSGDPMMRELLAILLGRASDRDARFVMKHIFSFLIGGHLETGVMMGSGFAWDLPDMQLAKWFLDRRMLAASSRLTADFSFAETATFLRLLQAAWSALEDPVKRGTDPETGRIRILRALAGFSLDWLLSEPAEGGDIPPLVMQAVSGFWQALPALSSSGHRQHAEDLVAAYNLLMRDQLDFADRPAAALLSDLLPPLAFLLTRGHSLWQSVHDLLPPPDSPAGDGAETLRRLMTGFSRPLALASPSERQSLVYMLKDPRLGVADGLWSNLVSEADGRAAAAGAAAALARVNKELAIRVSRELDSLITGARSLILYLQPRIAWEPPSTASGEGTAKTEAWQYGFGIMGRMSDQPDLFLYPQTDALRAWLTGPSEQPRTDE